MQPNGFIFGAGDLVRKIAPKLTKLVESFGCKYILIVVPVGQLGLKGANLATNMQVDETEAICKDIAQGLANRKGPISPLVSSVQ
jgi:hypothetical protein